MPRLSCWFVRAALLYLAARFTLGAFILANKGLGFYPSIWRFLPVHMELLLMGWLVQLALGIAYWILPRHIKGAPRGNEAWIELAFWLINLGIGWVIAETVFTLQGLALIGRVAECAAVLVFILGSWRRVRPFAGS